MRSSSPIRARPSPFITSAIEDDPRVGHALTLAVDDYGNVLTSAAIGYARRKSALEEQDHVLTTLAENQYTNAILQPDAYRAPITSQASAYELTAPALSGARPLAFDAVEVLAGSAHRSPTMPRRPPGGSRSA